MTNKKRRPDPLANLEKWLDDETLSMPIEEVREELRSLGDDPEAIPERMRAIARSVSQGDGTSRESKGTALAASKSGDHIGHTRHATSAGVPATRSRQSAQTGAMKMAAKGKGGAAIDPLGPVFERDIVINGHKFSASVPPTRDKYVVLHGSFFDPAWRLISVAGTTHELEVAEQNARRCVGLKKLRFEDALKQHKAGKSVIRFE